MEEALNVSTFLISLDSLLLRLLYYLATYFCILCSDFVSMSSIALMAAVRSSVV
jgi:hypothetical protein